MSVRSGLPAGSLSGPVETWTVLPSTMRAQPLMTVTPCFFSSAPTPPVSRPTTSSFQRMVCARSMRRLHLNAEDARALGKPLTFSNSSAAWMSALEGCSRRLRQVPPRRAPSTSVVWMPELRSANGRDVASRARRRARGDA
jgi:hypothetical protein